MFEENFLKYVEEIDFSLVEDGGYSLVEVSDFNMVGLSDFKVINFEIVKGKIEMEEIGYKYKFEEDFKGSDERFLNEWVKNSDSEFYVIKGGI